jgi:hypothetical protein
MHIGVDLNCQTVAGVGRNLWRRTQCWCVLCFLFFASYLESHKTYGEKMHVGHERRGTFLATIWRFLFLGQNTRVRIENCIHLQNRK